MAGTRAGFRHELYSDTLALVPAMPYSQRMAVNNRPRECTRCVAEVEAGERIPGMIGKEWLPCAVCGEPTCGDHGHGYPGGWEHEDCHESPLYSRYDD